MRSVVHVRLGVEIGIGGAGARSRPEAVAWHCASEDEAAVAGTGAEVAALDAVGLHSRADAGTATAADTAPGRRCQRRARRFRIIPPPQPGGFRPLIFRA